MSVNVNYTLIVTFRGYMISKLYHVTAIYGACAIYGALTVLVLKWLMTSEKLTGMHARWASILQEYDVDIQHRAGVTHGDADGLGSRNPLPSEEDRTDARMHHDSPVTSVTAGLALLACVGTEAIETAADQPTFGG